MNLAMKSDSQKIYSEPDLLEDFGGKYRAWLTNFINNIFNFFSNVLLIQYISPENFCL